MLTSLHLGSSLLRFPLRTVLALIFPRSDPSAPRPGPPTETWATGPVCRGFLQNCECFRCTTYDNDEEAPDTKGVTDMDDLGMRNCLKDGKERKRPCNGPPSPIA